MFRLVNGVTGDVYIFYGFNNHGRKGGRLRERTTRSWQEAHWPQEAGQVYDYNTDGTIATITTPAGQDEIISFQYSGGRVTNIYVGPTWPTDLHYMEVEYTYKGVSYASDLGGADDLVQVKVRRKGTDGNWIERYTQYRYFNSSPIDGKLKCVIESDAIQRIIDANGGDAINNPSDILSLADTDTVNGVELKNYFSRSFTYHTAPEDTSSVGGQDLEDDYGGVNFDETGRVKSETVNGTCASCGGAGGTATYEYHYMKGT